LSHKRRCASLEGPPTSTAHSTERASTTSPNDRSQRRHSGPPASALRRTPSGTIRQQSEARISTLASDLTPAARRSELAGQFLLFLLGLQLGEQSSGVTP
jgi:hypothetical protein